ncbi:hypothetical protein [Dyella sp. EPa41]|uniref:hypothetical protein n=1 Tax=Dyella sp. EPa41 TaxID=1561194 RepID=UPI001915D0B5|nr:hypothetical protein [Dyella sp. EPa41]
MNPVQFIKEQFDRSGLELGRTTIVSYSEKSFGDFVAEVETMHGLLRIERERGQCFVDYFDDTTGAFVRGDIKWPQLLPIFESGSWSLSDLLKVLG